MRLHFAPFGKVAPDLFARAGADVGCPALLPLAQADEHHTCSQVNVGHVQRHQFADAHPRVQQKQAHGLVPFAAATAQDRLDVLTA